MVFQDVDAVEALVQVEQFAQPPTLRRAQVLAVAQEQIPASLQDLAHRGLGLLLLVAAYLVDHLSIRLDQVKQVEDDPRLRAMPPEGLDERLPHVHRHRFDGALLRGGHAFEEAVEGLFAAPLAHPDTAREPVVGSGSCPPCRAISSTARILRPA